MCNPLTRAPHRTASPQTEREVELSLLIPPGTKGRELKPRLLDADLRAGEKAQTLRVERTAAAGGGGGAATTVLFEAKLAYPVEEPKEGDDLRDEISWEVSDYEAGVGGRRLLRLTFVKKEVRIWDASQTRRARLAPPIRSLTSRSSSPAAGTRRHRVVDARPRR